MDRLDVVRGHRLTLAKMRENSIQAGLEMPAATEVLFSEYIVIRKLNNQARWTAICLLYRVRASRRQAMTSEYTAWLPLIVRCTLDLDHCFGSFGQNAETSYAHDVFKRITFERPECGDCREYRGSGARKVTHR
jgi:hypothetical protein